MKPDLQYVRHCPLALPAKEVFPQDRHQSLDGLSKCLHPCDARRAHGRLVHRTGSHKNGVTAHVTTKVEEVLVGGYLCYERALDSLANPHSCPAATSSLMFVVGGVYRNHNEFHPLAVCGLLNPTASANNLPPVWVTTSTDGAPSCEEVARIQVWVVVIQSADHDACSDSPSKAGAILRASSVPHNESCTVLPERATSPQMCTVVAYRSFTSTLTWGMELCAAIQFVKELQREVIISWSPHAMHTLQPALHPTLTTTVLQALGSTPRTTTRT